jgi:ribosomal-protein-alanine N-acetyltransferase
MSQSDCLIAESARLRLVVPGVHRAAAVAAYVAKNHDHFAPWAPDRGPRAATEDFWHRQLATGLEEFERGASVRMVLLPRDGGAEPVGDASLTNIVRGPFQACNLGYRLALSRVGHGYMHEALRAVIDYAFGELHLHRIMANYAPTNARSARLLRRLGFSPEGYARDYLFLAGAWQDHVLTSLINPRARPPELVAI